MKTFVPEETWPLVDRFLRESPEVLEKLTIIQEVVEESERRAEQRGEQRGKQQTLLQVLHHKFGEPPAQIVEKIEITSDLTQLVRWIEQALDANALTEIDFNPLAAADSSAGHA